MDALQDRRARLLASLYTTYGEAAEWTPVDGGAAVSVMVRRRGEDVDAGFGMSVALVWKDFLKVRVSELAVASLGDLVAFPATGETFRIIAEPRKVKAGMEWVCEPGQVRT